MHVPRYQLKNTDFTDLEETQESELLSTSQVHEKVGGPHLEKHCGRGQS